MLASIFKECLFSAYLAFTKEWQHVAKAKKKRKRKNVQGREMVALSCNADSANESGGWRPWEHLLRTVAGPAGCHCSVQQVEGAGRIYNGEHDTLCTRRMDVSCGRRNYSCRILFLFGRTRF